MSPRFPALKPKQVLRALLKAGFEIHHQKGKPRATQASEKADTCEVTVPSLKNILRQAELTLEEFKSYL